MKGKRILILYDFLSEHGGIERIMHFQARTLVRAGYEIVFGFAYVNWGLKREELSDFKVVEYSKLPIKNEAMQISLSLISRDQIKKYKEFDLVICHSFPASYFALRLKKKYKIPYILHLHHPPQFLYTADKDWASNSFKRKLSFIGGKLLRAPLKKFDNYCVRNADDYFLEGETVQKIVKETYKVDGTVLYPTVNEKFKIQKHNLKELSKFGIHKKYVLGSGRIISQKRFDYLIKAFSKLKHQDYQLVLVGKYDEDTKRNLEKVAKLSGFEPLFLGSVELEELVRLYNLAEVTVLTCPKEWFGIVPIEAMACGCPVVAWKDNFGPQETVIEGETGLLAEPYNFLDLADKIKLSLSKKWNKKTISKSVEKFSEKEIGDRLIKSVKLHKNM